MTAGTLTRSAHGLSSGSGRRWEDRAACAGMWDLHTAPPAPGAAINSPHGPQAAASHVCLAHCPVFAQCYQFAQERRPIEVVQAGLWWPTWHSQKPRRLPDPGCGPHCWELRQGGAR